MINKFVYTLSLLTCFILASCLQQEKTTQCTDGEAFNATERRCVPTTLDPDQSVRIASINPTSSYAISFADPSRTHSVSVSDPLNIGHVVRWNITYPNGSTFTLATGSTYTLIHTAFAAGSYIMEVQLFNVAQDKLLDSRSWTVNIIAQRTPTLTSTTPSPFTTTIAAANTVINATATNSDLIPAVNFQWYVNGSPVAGQSGFFSGVTQAISFSFDPNDPAYFVGAGVYNIQLILSENGTGSTYTIQSWTVTNNLPNFANITLGTGTAGMAAGIATPTVSSTIWAIDEVQITGTPGEAGFRTDINSNGVISDAGDAIDFCVQADDVAGIDGNNVFVEFQSNGVTINTFVPMALANTSYCLGADALASFNINVADNLNGFSTQTITAIVYDGYSGASNSPSFNGGTEIVRYNWPVRARPKNTPPVVTIDDVNSNIVCDASANPNLRNNCIVTQDTAVNVAITVTDDDYDPTVDFDKFSVKVTLSGVDIDGTNPASISDCVHAANETLNVSRYICSLVINSYDDNGPVAPGAVNYDIVASVSDIDSPFTGVGSTSLTTATWEIRTANDIDTGASINAFNDVAGATVPATTTDSYIAKSTSAGVRINLNANSLIGAPEVTEGENLSIRVAVDEPERDDHYISIFRCTDATIACTTPVFEAGLAVNSSDGENIRRSDLTISVPEDAVIGATAGIVFYRVLVRSSAGSVVDLDDEIISFAVANNNPDPVFDDTTFSPLNNANAGATLTVMPGFPITLDPKVITDASTADGDTILYQWMVAIDSNADGLTNDEVYAPIEGATDRKLIWTPGSEIDFAIQTGTAVTIKLCLGDDGWDNGLDLAKTAMNGTQTDCLKVTLDSDEWSLTALSNMYIGQSYAENTALNTSRGQVAVWIDKSKLRSSCKVYGLCE